MRTWPLPPQRSGCQPLGPSLQCDLGGPSLCSGRVFSGDGRFLLFFLARCLCFRAWSSRAQGGMWGAPGLPGQVGTELGALLAVPDCPWEEPHEEEVRSVWLTPQQRHRHREHTGGAGEKVGGAGGWDRSVSSDPRSGAKQSRQEGVPTLCSSVPHW